MSANTLLSGYSFCDLLAHGREMDQVIARKDGSLLQHSTPELERWLNSLPAALPRLNGFLLAFVLLFFTLTFASDLLVLIAALPDTAPPVTAALYFIPAMLFTFANLSAVFLVSRGKTAGLAWFGRVHQALLCLTAVLLFCSAFAGEKHHVVMSGVSLALMLLCRTLFNRPGFILFVLYARTQRIAILARRLRVESYRE